MVYLKYGSTFRNMRKNSGKKLTDFADVGISPSTLSDFELGKTMISLEKIDQALQLIGSSLGDYDNFLNNYLPSDPIYIFEEIEEAFIINDKDRLLELLDICKKINQDIVGLSIEVILENSSSDDRQKIISFLYDTPLWGRKELYLLYIMEEYLNPYDLINILRRFKFKSQGIYSSTIYNRDVTIVLCEAILVLTKYGFKNETNNIIKAIDKNHLTRTMFLRNLYMGVKGFWIYKFENKILGEKMITDFLKILELAAQKEIYLFYKNKFNKYLDKTTS